MRRRLLVIWFVFIVATGLLYLLWGRDLIVVSLEGKGPAWFDSLMATFYPRFAVEKYRFNTAFFLSKADQVIIRFCLVQLVLLAFVVAYVYKMPFRKQVRDFWNIHTSVIQVRWLQVLFYLGMLFFTYDWLYYLNLVRPAATFYKPLLILRIFGLGFPSVPVSIVLFSLLMLSYAAGILRFKPVISSAVAAVLFVLLQGWLHSFEKIDHTYSTLTYAALLMPFLVYEYTKAVNTASAVQAGWPLQLICVCIAMVYLMAGLEKLLIAGTEWFNPESFRSYLYLHQTPAGMWVAQHDGLCTLLPLLAMLFQLGFAAILFFPRLKGFILLSGVAFHTGTYVLLEVGWYINAWVFVYIFFIDWTRLDSYFRAR